MDSNTFNWIAMAVLSALLLAFGMPVLLEVMHSSGHGKEVAQAGYKLPDPPEGGTASATAPADEGFQVANVVGLLPQATADAGERVYKKCAACHTVNEGGKNGQGPNLWNIVGRDKGAVDGFKYSKALVEKGGAWDYQALAEFMHKPKDYIQGTKMAFAGLKSEKDIANLLAYLQTLSASPVPFPEVAAAPEAPAEAKPAEAAPQSAAPEVKGDSAGQPAKTE